MTRSYYILGESIEADEAEFGRMLKKRSEDGGKIKVVSVAKVESEVEVKDIITLTDVIAALKEKFPKLVHLRIPVCNSAAPKEVDFDALCSALCGTNVNTPVIVNCQVSLKLIEVKALFKCKVLCKKTIKVETKILFNKKLSNLVQTVSLFGQGIW